MRTSSKRAWWESGREWRAPPLAREPGSGWALARARSFSPLPAQFLPASPAALPAGKLLVRDGLFPLLAFFARNPAPPRRFATRLLVHADWCAFIPPGWRRHCRAYLIACNPGPGLLQKPLAERARRKAVFALQLSPQYCPLPRLAALLARVPRLSAFSGILEHGPGTIEHQLAALELLREVCAHPPGVVPVTEVRYFLDLRSSLFLDLNARYFCADDANLHLCLARGALLPGSKRLKGEFHRVSAFHGYYELPLPAGSSRFWKSRGPAYTALRAAAARRGKFVSRHPLEPWTELLERYRLPFAQNVF